MIEFTRSGSAGLSPLGPVIKVVAGESRELTGAQEAYLVSIGWAKRGETKEAPKPPAQEKPAGEVGAAPESVAEDLQAELKKLVADCGSEPEKKSRLRDWAETMMETPKIIDYSKSVKQIIKQIVSNHE